MNMARSCKFKFPGVASAASDYGRNCTNFKLVISKMTDKNQIQNFKCLTTHHLSPIKDDLCTKYKSTREESLPLQESKQNNFNFKSDAMGKTSEQRENISEMLKGIKMKPARTLTVSVEGNVGSGKSTFLNYFSSSPDVSIIQEPIEKWQNVGGHNLLQKLYEDPKRWSFLFQSYVQLTRLKMHLQSSTRVRMIERSFYNNRFCFVESGLKDGSLTAQEYEVLSQYYDLFEKTFDIGIDLFVYLRTTPEVALERMRKRGRNEEADVSLEYLKQVHESHENWLVKGKPNPAPARVLVLDGDLGLPEITKEYERHRKTILGL